MIYETVITFLMVVFFVSLDNKLELSQKLDKYLSKKKKGRLIHELINCRFCFSFWIGLISYFFLVHYYIDFKFDLLVPILASGAYMTIKP